MLEKSKKLMVFFGHTDRQTDVWIGVIHIVAILFEKYECILY